MKIIKTEIQRLQDRIERFQKDKFPGQPLLGKLKHLGQEVRELKNNPHDEMEWADVFILTLGSAAHYGYTVSNLIALANSKMDVNDQREWHPPDAHGVCHHKENNFMTAEQQHLARLRELQRRYDCAENVNNEAGMTMIQNLIDNENKRWEQHDAAPETKGTK